MRTRVSRSHKALGDACGRAFENQWRKAGNEMEGIEEGIEMCNKVESTPVYTVSVQHIAN